MTYRLRTTVFLLSVFGIVSWLFHPRVRNSRPHGASMSISGADNDILNRTLGFHKVFVINLPSRSDRRDAMALAGALSGIELDWIDGVVGDQVPEKVLPADSLDKKISTGNRGSWRAHMNALRSIIQQNLTTALILEDDIDWDIRLKQQLQNFSLASRTYLHHLSNPSTKLSPPPLSSNSPNSQVTTISLSSLPHLPPPTSPYGPDWDVLWLGHCGTSFPPPPSLHITLPHDPTVPSPPHLRPHPFAGPDLALLDTHPPHTRVIHSPGPGTTCTQSYAVSRRAALALLYRFGTQTLTAGWDLMLGDWCAGVYDQDVGVGGDDSKGENHPVCVTLQPPLFAQHYGRGGASDITAPGGGFIDRGREMTPYVRLSVRLNMGALVRGDGEAGLRDQWPDGEEA